LVGTFVTPYFGREWLTAFEVSGHVGTFRAIEEFQPATILQHSTGLLLLQVALLALLCFASQVIPPVGPLLVGVGGVLAGLGVVKFMPFSAIIMSVLLAVWWRDSIHVRSNAGTQSPLVNCFVLVERKLKALQSQTLGALAFFMCCIAWVYAAHAIKHPINDLLIPRRAVEFVKRHDLSHPVLNEMGTGGLLMYNWSSPEGEPSHLVAIDGRTNVGSKGVWTSLQKARLGREGWSEYIDLVDPKTIIWRNGSPFVTLLLESPEWCRVFQSGITPADVSVFVARELLDVRREQLQSSDCPA
jgi:hypothetical protein